MAVVYAHLNPTNGLIFYIGIGKKEKRAYDFNGSRGKFWKDYVSKYGLPDVNIICKDIDFEAAKKHEIYLISIYGRRIDGGQLVNLTLGGDGVLGLKTCLGRKQTEESKIKISKSRKGKNTGKDHLYYGKKREKIVGEKSRLKQQIYRYFAQHENDKLIEAKSTRELQTKTGLCRTLIMNRIKRPNYFNGNLNRGGNMKYSKWKIWREKII